MFIDMVRVSDIKYSHIILGIIALIVFYISFKIFLWVDRKVELCMTCFYKVLMQCLQNIKLRKKRKSSKRGLTSKRNADSDKVRYEVTRARFKSKYQSSVIVRRVVDRSRKVKHYKSHSGIRKESPKESINKLKTNLQNSQNKINRFFLLNLPIKSDSKIYTNKQLKDLIRNSGQNRANIFEISERNNRDNNNPVNIKITHKKSEVMAKNNLMKLRLRTNGVTSSVKRNSKLMEIARLFTIEKLLNMRSCYHKRFSWRKFNSYNSHSVISIIKKYSSLFTEREKTHFLKSMIKPSMAINKRLYRLLTSDLQKRITDPLMITSNTRLFNRKMKQRHLYKLLNYKTKIYSCMELYSHIRQKVKENYEIIWDILRNIKYNLSHEKLWLSEINLSAESINSLTCKPKFSSQTDIRYNFPKSSKPIISVNGLDKKFVNSSRSLPKLNISRSSEKLRTFIRMNNIKPHFDFIKTQNTEKKKNSCCKKSASEQNITTEKIYSSTSLIPEFYIQNKLPNLYLQRKHALELLDGNKEKQINDGTGDARLTKLMPRSKSAMYMENSKKKRFYNPAIMNLYKNAKKLVQNNIKTETKPVSKINDLKTRIKNAKAIKNPIKSTITDKVIDIKRSKIHSDTSNIGNQEEKHPPSKGTSDTNNVDRNDEDLLVEQLYKNPNFNENITNTVSGVKSREIDCGNKENYNTNNKNIISSDGTRLNIVNNVTKEKNECTFINLSEIGRSFSFDPDEFMNIKKYSSGDYIEDNVNVGNCFHSFGTSNNKCAWESNRSKFIKNDDRTITIVTECHRLEEYDTRYVNKYDETEDNEKKSSIKTTPKRNDEDNIKKNVIMTKQKGCNNSNINRMTIKNDTIQNSQPNCKNNVNKCKGENNVGTCVNVTKNTMDNRKQNLVKDNFLPDQSSNIKLEEDDKRNLEEQIKKTTSGNITDKPITDDLNTEAIIKKIEERCKKFQHMSDDEISHEKIVLNKYGCTSNCTNGYFYAEYKFEKWPENQESRTPYESNKYFNKNNEYFWGKNINNSETKEKSDDESYSNDSFQLRKLNQSSSKDWLLPNVCNVDIFESEPHDKYYKTKRKTPLQEYLKKYSIIIEEVNNTPKEKSSQISIFPPVIE